MTTFKQDLENEILTNHLNADEFGEVVNYNPQGGGSIFEINIIWDREYEAVDTESGQVVNTHQPMATARTADFTAQGVTARQNDQLTRDGVTYKVRQAQDNGVGVTELFLIKL